MELILKRLNWIYYVESKIIYIYLRIYISNCVNVSPKNLKRDSTKNYLIFTSHIHLIKIMLTKK